MSIPTSLTPSSPIWQAIERLFAGNSLDTSQGEPTGIEERIYDCVMQGSYRRSSASEATRKDALRKLARATEERRPVEFSVPFGCYKHWRSPSAPGVDWAEVFWILYLRDYASMMCAIYDPGVTITLSYCTLGVAEANGLSTEELSRYVAELDGLVRHCSASFWPSNLTMRLFNTAALYSQGAGEAELRENLVKVREEWPTMQPQLRQKFEVSAERNLRGADDFQAITDSAQMVYAIDSLTKRRWFNKFSSRIQLVHVRGPEPAVHIGSCRTSVCQPNVGVGVVEVLERECRPRILSTSEARNLMLRYERIPQEQELVLPVTGLAALPTISSLDPG
jgi:hypothetical protein